MTTRLYPNSLQASRLERYLFVGRVAFNRALESRIHWYKTTGKTLSYNDQCGDLTALRAADSFWSDVPVQVERDGLRRIDKGFKAFFRRIKSGDTQGFPRFKARQRWNSFSIQCCGAVIKNGRIRVSGVGGLIRCRNLRPIVGEIVEQRIVRRVGKWFCQIVVDDKKELSEPRAIKTLAGIDVGLTTYAMLSDATTVSNPRFGKKMERKLAHAHRNVSRTVKGSQNRRKQVVRLHKVYQTISDHRSNFTHHASKAIVATYDFIAVEDLDISGLVQKKSRFTKSILDASWAQFIFQLSYKAEEAGATFVKVEARGTSQECSGCGAIVPKTLYERVHRCSHCGLVLDRDLNSSRVILKRGIELIRTKHPASVGRTVMPVEDSVASPMNQEVLTTLC